MKLVDAFRRKRQADQPAPVDGHEVDGLGRDELGGHGKVAFVFAVLVIDDDQHAAGADLFDRLGDGGKCHGWSSSGYREGRSRPACRLPTLLDYIPDLQKKLSTFEISHEFFDRFDHLLFEKLWRLQNDEAS